MIIYYSATGNCKYVANEIADKTRDIAVSMIGHDYSIYLKKGESLGIVVPVHFWVFLHLSRSFCQKQI